MEARGGVQGVAKNFRDVFRDLAPGGRGELVMQKRVHREVEAAEGPDGEGADGEEADDGESAISQKYSGVKVKVCAPS